MRSFEVVSDPANARLLVRVAEAFGVQARGVPVTFIGSFAPIMGFESDETTGRLIEERVRECLARGCEDVVGPLGRATGPLPAGGARRREPAPPAAGSRPPAAAGAGTPARFWRCPCSAGRISRRCPCSR